MLQPRPAGAAHRVAALQAERQPLRGLRGVHQAESVAAGAVRAGAEAHAHGGHRPGLRDAVALPRAGDGVVADGGARVGQQAEFAGREQGGVCAERVRSEGADVVEVFHRAPADALEGAFDGGEVLVDVHLEDSARFGAQPCRAPQHPGVGGVLRHGNRQGRVDQPGPVPAGEVAFAALAVRAHLPQHAADTGLLGGLGQDRDVDGRAGPGIGDGGEPATQRFQRGQFRRQVGALLVECAFQWLPDRLEDLRRLPERLRLAETLRQVVVRVHEARHQQRTSEVHRSQATMGADQLARRPDVPEDSTGHPYGMAPDRPLGQQEHIRHEQQLIALELLGPRYGSRGRRGTRRRGRRGTRRRGRRQQSPRPGQPGVHQEGPAARPRLPLPLPLVLTLVPGPLPPCLVRQRALLRGRFPAALDRAGRR